MSSSPSEQFDLDLADTTTDLDDTLLGETERGQMVDDAALGGGESARRYRVATVGESVVEHVL